MWGWKNERIEKILISLFFFFFFFIGSGKVERWKK